MKRVIMHWTAGRHTPNAIDFKHYHFIIDGTGVVHRGVYPVEANEVIRTNGYAAHTSRMNTGSIGVSLAAMAGATDGPFNAGRYPITTAQVDAMARLVADLCRKYAIPVTRQTVLTHAEVEPTLGVKQAGKWDIRWLPGMTQVGGAIDVGDNLRARVKAVLDGHSAPVPVQPDPAAPIPPKPSFWPAFIAWLAGLKGPKT